MRMRIVAIVGQVLLVLISTGLPSAAKELGTILVPAVPSRLVELRAVVNLTNESTTPVDRYHFRLTAPADDLPYQRARLATASEVATWGFHKNGIDRYIELKLAVPAKATISRELRFLVLLLPTDYLKAAELPVAASDTAAARDYLQPSPLVESDASEVKKAAGRLFAPEASELQKAKAAYEYPARVLKYRVQKPAGAVEALRIGSGDCTEYAALFCALCRAGGLPARRAAVFNLGSKTEITTAQPNHETAEVFLATHGWVPVDPNVGGGKYDRPVGFARAGNTQITLKRENAWVWSTFLPPDGFARNMPKPLIKAKVNWRCKVVQEGSTAKLLDKFGEAR